MARNASRSRRGANAVEFAILLPVFVLLVGGSIDLSWYMVQRGAMRTAIARGCRAGSLVDPGANQVRVADVYNQAKNRILAIYEQGAGECKGCEISTALEGTIPNRALRCELVAPWAGLAPTLSGITSTGMRDEVVVRMEFQRSP